MVNRIQYGAEAVYQKLDKDPEGGHKIKPDWFVNTSGPFSVEVICTSYLQAICDGDVDNASEQLLLAANAYASFWDKER